MPDFLKWTQLIFIKIRNNRYEETFIFFLTMILVGISANAQTANTIKGDLNGDGFLDLSDVSKLVSYIVRNDISSVNQDILDIDNDKHVNVVDVVKLITMINVKNCLAIIMRSGKVYYYSLDDNPVTTYLNGNLTVSATSGTETFPLEDVWKYIYVNKIQ